MGSGGFGSSKIRFEMAPRRVAQDIESECETQEGRLQMHVQAGSAAKMAEAEAPCAAPRPYTMRIKARNGKPFRVDDTPLAASPLDESTQPNAVQSETVDGVSDKRTNISTIARSPSLAASHDQRLAAPAGSATKINENVLPGPARKNDQNAPRSPLQRMKALFSRTFPKTATDGRE